MFDLDKGLERFTRRLAQTGSRRSALRALGGLMLGAAALPLLPVARGNATIAGGGSGVPPETSGNPQDPGDRNACDYWRYCAIDGFLCSCCGGSPSQCPPGSDMAVLTWIGTCQNPVDNRHYIISYNDCCGISSCGRCMCNRNDRDRPVVRPQSNNDTNWCVGSSSSVYVCSTAVIIGLAT
ncbi:amine dehydrogenase [Bradyrhizobium sp. KB893862 SZCCT0404]|uniref:methylamine dehydrogenase light chain n=1 Tax=Bradyrhizobium sp. KB893862 SZCCT0404 TaxID=2807672 RepID=UPI001BABE86D|nr:methylamine dehydrogenase light chain [Bradyrhizobium sp. KB893862 SZCCT0404]MBR1177030.1 amine dehydrogenase [Bradyrhizobium sp. KB893862 SZCCT0404]